MTVKAFKKILILGLSLVASLMAYAQKADPSEGVKAPANVKVDGKVAEWGELQLRNKSTMLNYLMANDATNLYLVVTCTDQKNINKLLGGGLTLAINKEGKKKEKDGVIIGFPVVKEFNVRSSMRLSGYRSAATVDTAAVIAARKQAIAGFKELSITGVKEISDTLISIYNTYGIKAVLNMDAKNNLNYELAIPLKLLQADFGKELAFNLRLEGIHLSSRNNDSSKERSNPGKSTRSEGSGDRYSSNRSNGSSGAGGDFLEMLTPSDFWAKYKLIKP